MQAVRHVSEVRVRYADTDKMGVVYNGVYLQYFEIARTELLRAIGLPYTHLEAEGVLLPVLEAHVEYLRPARYDDVLSLHATYAPEHGAPIRISYNVCVQDATLATGYTRHSFVDAATWRPVRPPAIFTTAVQRALQDVA
jgi:acyl-CoA thioester hydrolase